MLSKDPDEAAKYYVDSHMKIILEIGLMMSTAVWYVTGQQHPRDFRTSSGLYKPTHINHPVSKWVHASQENFLWASELAHVLNREKQYRWPHRLPHASIACVEKALSYRDLFPSCGLTPFALAMPEEYKTEDPVESYRDFYRYGKAHLHKWTRREPPSWL